VQAPVRLSGEGKMKNFIFRECLKCGHKWLGRYDVMGIDYHCPECGKDLGFEREMQAKAII